MMRTQREQVMMEVGKMDSGSSREQLEKSKTSMEEEDRGEEGVMLPGFRFHPTDEELVGFYLRRKVEKRTIAFEIIKQIDIYRYDPWDLPKVSSVGDKEWYFFCMRGRKYKNSGRPNRVTGSGFWKATGIDKHIFSVKQPHDTVGLKKSLVYYRGSAGKGTKTDWMMHEFRLPLNSKDLTSNIALEAEVWTLCRIFRKVPTYKYSPAVKELISSRITKQNSYINSSSKTCSSSLESETSSEHCVSFDGIQFQNSSMKPFTVSIVDARNNQLQHWNNMCYARSELSANPFPVTNNYWSFWNQNCNLNNGDGIIEDGSWDELRSVVELALN